MSFPAAHLRGSSLIPISHTLQYSYWQVSIYLGLLLLPFLLTARLQNCAYELCYICLPVSVMHVTTQEALNGSSWHLILGSFTRLCRQILISVKLRKNNGHSISVCILSVCREIFIGAKNVTNRCCREKWVLYTTQLYSISLKRFLMLQWKGANMP
jgi:hypothetical protein